MYISNSSSHTSTTMTVPPNVIVVMGISESSFCAESTKVTSLYTTKKNSLDLA